MAGAAAGPLPESGALVLDFSGGDIEEILDGRRTSTARLLGTKNADRYSTLKSEEHSRLKDMLPVPFVAVSRDRNSAFASCELVDVSVQRLRDLCAEGAVKEGRASAADLRRDLSGSCPDAAEGDEVVVFGFRILGSMGQELVPTGAEKLAPFNPIGHTPRLMALEMLFGPEGHGVATGDTPVIFMDLGCGDGQMLAAAAGLFEERCRQRCKGSEDHAGNLDCDGSMSASSTARCIGVEYDFALVQKARRNAASRAGAASVSVLHADSLSREIREMVEQEATHVFVYLCPTGLGQLQDSLTKAVLRGCAVVSYVFAVPGWRPQDVRLYRSVTKLYLYTRVELAEPAPRAGPAR